MGLGVTIRLVRLLLVHPLWGDECYVVANLIERGYVGLLRPLDYLQVVPILFLWAELSITKLLGFSEWSLRLFPTFCAIASLFVFRHMASRLMKGLPLLLGVAIVAVSLNPIRHGGEAKPYAVRLPRLDGAPGDPGRVVAPARAVKVALGPRGVHPTRDGVFAAVGVRAGRDQPGDPSDGSGRTASLAWSRLLPRVPMRRSWPCGVAILGPCTRRADAAEVKFYMLDYWSAMFPPA